MDLFPGVEPPLLVPGAAVAEVIGGALLLAAQVLLLVGAGATSLVVRCVAPRATSVGS